MKKVYISPVLEKIGAFEELTRGNADGSFTDAFFPTETPKEELTFSDMP